MLGCSLAHTHSLPSASFVVASAAFPYSALLHSSRAVTALEPRLGVASDREISGRRCSWQLPNLTVSPLSHPNRYSSSRLSFASPFHHPLPPLTHPGSAPFVPQADCFARVRRSSRTSRLLSRAKRSLGRAAVMRERTQLKMTSALLDRQLERIGATQRLLLTRPTPLSASVLVDPQAALQSMRSTAARGHGKRAGGTLASFGSGWGRSDEILEIDAEWRAAARDWTRAARELVAEICSEVMESVTRALTEEEMAVLQATYARGSKRDRELGGKIDKIEKTIEKLVEGTRHSARDGDGVAGRGGDASESSSSARAASSISEATSETNAQLSCLETWKAHGDSDGWLAALSLVDGLPQAQRAQRYLLPGYSYLYGHFRAIPGSVISVAAATGVHYALKPHWAQVVSYGKAARAVAAGVWGKRFYTPGREIVLDLLNRQPRLSDAAALEDSESSLASMLKDFAEEQRGRLGGGGRKLDRAAELAEVSRAYEAEIKRGAVKTIFRGKLVRLILIQMQLLKTESLKAMGALDDLVDANRLNMQLLACGPAVLLCFGSSRFFFNLLNMIRSRGVRSLRRVHAQMGRTLNQLERCLVLAGSPRPTSADELSSVGVGGGVGGGGGGGGETRQGARGRKDAPNKGRSSSSWLWRKASGEKGSQGHAEASATAASHGLLHDDCADGGSPKQSLHGAELGEFVLHVHSYLVLLDYSALAYPKGAADAIHHELQDLLRQGELSVKQQSDLLRSIKDRHAELLKALW